MLINTVVMLLRELLPLVVLSSLLLAWLPAGQAVGLLWRVLLLAVPLLLMQSSLVGELAALFDGQGLEIWYAICYLACSLLLALLLRLGSAATRARLWQAALALVALLLVNGSNLALYLVLYPRQTEDSQALWLGAALGCGISLSIAVLMYHCVRELGQYWKSAAAILLCASGARQISAAVAIGHQLELVPGANPLWFSDGSLAEGAELGYFLNALLGYEASLSQGQSIAWCLTVLLLLALRRRESK